MKIFAHWEKTKGDKDVLDINVSSDNSDIAEELYHAIQDFMSTREGWEEV
jgi:hypothetical protein